MRHVWISALCLLLASCAGYQAYEDGRQLMMEGDVERGLAKLQEAAKAAPDNAQYRRAYEQNRKVVIEKYVSEGDMQRNARQFDASETLYRKALALDPTYGRAQTGLVAIVAARRQGAVVEEARAKLQANELEEAEKTVREVLSADPDQREARALLVEINERRAKARAAAAPAALNSPFVKPITLEFRDASLKSVFEVISRTSGLNFIFDRDVRADTKINIFVRNTSLEDVVKLILVTNQLDRKLLNENSVLIYPNTPAKQKEYRELVMRSFYLANADVKQALNLVKGMVKTPDVFVDEKLNLMVVKDTPDAMRVIDQLVRALDLAEPEVMLELEVLELSTSRLQTLGIDYPDAINFGKPSATIGSTTTTTGGPFVIGTDSLKAYTINPPLVANILATDADANVLANPRIRVKNREKAKVHIGSRVPVVTTTSTANVGVSSSVSYLDVGLKLDVEPNIYLRDEVAIKVGLEVSNIIRTVPLEGGTLAYELGTRNTATVLQLKDGETQILAGLISDEDRRSANKVPGLGDFPMLGRLFRSQTDDKRKTELVLLVTPHIVRTLDWSQSALANVPVGTDAAIGVSPLRIAQTPPGTLALAPAGGAAGVQALRAGTPLPRALSEGAPGEPPAPSAPGAAGTPAQPEASAEQEGGPASPSVTAAAPGSVAALLLAAPLAARAGSDVLVSMALAPGGAATRATVELVYDPLQLEALGTPASSPGRVPLRVEGSAVMRFKVLVSAGRAQVRVENAVAVDSAGNSVPVNAPVPIDITITP